MKSLIYYLLQAIIVSGLLYGYYHFFLRNKKFHPYNRFYLLAVVVLSLLIPFLHIPVYFQTDQPAPIFQTLNAIKLPFDETIMTGDLSPLIYNESAKFNWQMLAWGFYILIACFVLVKIFFSLKKIRTIIRKNEVQRIEDINFINTNEKDAPFSFFKWLFWHRDIELRSEKGEQIFRHELFHIQQRHSWDVIFMELVTATIWINPFYHLIKKELRVIHEFLADEFAVTAKDKWEFAEFLLMKAFNTNKKLINPFFNNQIKRRIAMITSSKKPSYQYLRKLMVLPIAAIVFAMFAFSYKQKQISSTIQTPSKQMQKITQSNSDTLFVSNLSFKNLNGQKLLIDSVKMIGFNNTKKDTSIPINKVLFVVIRQGKSEMKSYLDINNIEPKDISSMNVLKGKSAIDKYGEKGKNGVVEIFIKEGTKDIKEVSSDKFDVKPVDPISQEEARKLLQQVFTALKNSNVELFISLWHLDNVLGFNNKIFDRQQVIDEFEDLKKFMAVPVTKNTPIRRITIEQMSPFFKAQYKIKAYFRIDDTLSLAYGFLVDYIDGKWQFRWHGETTIAPHSDLDEKLEQEISEAFKNYDYSKLDFNDPEVKKKWHDMIVEVCAISRKEGKAAYFYKGRTYVFAHIDPSKPENVNSFFESNGVTKQFILNGKLIHSIDEINSQYLRKDIRSINLLFPDQAKEKYHVDGSILEIETYDYKAVTKNNQ